MQSKATTVDQYLAQLPDERREALQTVRDVILEHLPEGYEEGMQYGMIGYFVPHSVYPAGYHCDPKQPLPFAGMASQKNHMSLYLMCIYGNEDQEAWFRKAWTKTGKKLDMGKSCIRFKKIEDVPLKVIGQAVKRVPVKKFVAFYESAIDTRSRSKKKKTATQKTAKKGAAKKKPAKKAAAKKTAAKKTNVKKTAAKKKTATKKKTVKKKATKKAVAKRTVKTTRRKK